MSNGIAGALAGLTADRCLVLLLGVGYRDTRKRLVYYATAVVTLGGDVAIFGELLILCLYRIDRLDPGSFSQPFERFM